MKHASAKSIALWSHQTLVLMTLLIFVATLKLPLLSTPGFESANLYVLLLGPFFAFSALSNSCTSQNNFFLILQRELSWLIFHIALIFSFLFFYSFYVSNCSPSSGVGTFFIVLIPPLLLNSSIGCVLAGLFRKFYIKLIILIFLYSSYFAYKLHFWWHEAPFRFISDISVIIPSDLALGAYFSQAAMTYRLGTLFAAGALLTLGSAFFSKNQRLKYLFFSCILASFAFISYAQSLSTLSRKKTELSRDYSLKLQNNNIIIFANPSKTSAEKASKFLQEALFYQKQFEKKLGTLSPQRVVIWLHESSDDKLLYTGAKNVDFAQPQFREIHITELNLLGHELAHIYSGDYASTFWKLPGRYWLIPNLALTEGIAMALTPELALSNDLELIDQARALHQAGLGIDIPTLFSLNPLDFIKHDFRAAYIFAGAFLEHYLKYIPDQERPKALQNIIHQGFLTPELQASLFKFLEQLEKPTNSFALGWAEENFGKSGIINADCSDASKNTRDIFWQHILNNNIDNALKINNNKILISQAIKYFFAHKKPREALKLARHENLELEMLHAYLVLKNYTEALDIANKIDIQKLSPSAHRQLIIQREILQDFTTSLDKNYEQLLSATLDLLSDPESSLIQFAYNLGAYRGPETLSVKMAYYLFARRLKEAGRCEEAIKILGTITGSASQNLALPQPILIEAKNIEAHCFFELKKYNNARIIYENLLKDSMGIKYKTMLERINFYE